MNSERIYYLGLSPSRILNVYDNFGREISEVVFTEYRVGIEFNNKIMITCVAQNYQHTSHKLSLITPLHILQVCAPNQMATLQNVKSHLSHSPPQSHLWSSCWHWNTAAENIGVRWCTHWNHHSVPEPRRAWNHKTFRGVQFGNVHKRTNTQTHAHIHTFSYTSRLPLAPLHTVPHFQTDLNTHHINTWLLGPSD